ncbi:lysine/ornithine N-monooxygenase [Chitinivorax tropicus]|uniref:Lysine/ornithine N-monooxygenase n=1 Tax=Chitinivorax tropicus TaxID=714531 RepID=A0A840MP11_9PROT|nr:lysine N(6)-hydroxylase/L-ornithine N(5)-oxygenase family protein [Chitinivorax tropicus]MBB5020378.1 lysine/ornithine N-monooxygenase [Chitinivorax tropicus]
MHIHDLIGIGFGPSNIGLAIALEEKQQRSKPLTSLFIEKQASFAWHPGMLLDHAHMQISYLKDLVTLRNPQSRFSFVSYLHEKGRLADFINLKTFYPSRHEFNDYLAWAASHFDDRCLYGEEVFQVLPETQGDQVSHLRIRSRDAQGAVRERLARNLVVSVGGSPYIPELFRPLRASRHVIHSHHYTAEISKHGGAKRVAIIGAGQSAAEIFMALHGHHNAPAIDFIMRARALKPADDSPYSNQIFDADFVDHIYSRDDQERRELIKEFWHTNYACPDLALIQQIFGTFYQQNVKGEDRHRLLRRHQIAAVRETSEGVTLTLQDLNNGHSFDAHYDLVVLATGYERQLHRGILEGLAGYVGEMQTDRHYRLQTTDNFQPQIFLQGACEHSHGLSDTLLSITAVRCGEIVDALHEGRKCPAASKLTTV